MVKAPLKCFIDRTAYDVEWAVAQTGGVTQCLKSQKDIPATAKGKDGQSVFGAIDQKVVALASANRAAG